MRIAIAGSGRLALAAFVVAFGLSEPARTAAAGGKGGAAPGFRMVYVRGPGDPDCEADLARARARGDASELFLTEFKCRVHARWKGAASCKKDELLVAHVTVKVQRNGQPSEAQVVRPSDSREFDEASLAAVKAGAPFPAPPAPLLDDTGAASLKIEFVCDCAERPRPSK